MKPHHCPYLGGNKSEGLNFAIHGLIPKFLTLALLTFVSQTFPFPSQ